MDAPQSQMAEVCTFMCHLRKATKIQPFTCGCARSRTFGSEAGRTSRSLNVKPTKLSPGRGSNMGQSTLGYG